MHWASILLFCGVILVCVPSCTSDTGDYKALSGSSTIASNLLINELINLTFFGHFGVTPAILKVLKASAVNLSEEPVKLL